MPDKSLATQKTTEKNAAIARLPEFKSLDLTDDPRQVVDMIKQVDAQADKLITEAVHEIDDQRYVMIGRCFSHLKSITGTGEYKAAIEELGRTYDEIKFQVKFTETYINQALTRKKDIDVLFGPGMMGTMSRLFNRGELKALGDGKKVHGLSDKNLASMSQRDVIAHVKAAKASEAEAIIEASNLKSQRDKANKKINTQTDKINNLLDHVRLLTTGPEDLQDVGALADNAINEVTSACHRIRQMNKLRQSEKAFEIMATTIKYCAAQVRLLYNEIDGIKSTNELINDADIEKTMKKISGTKQPTTNNHA